MELNGKETAVLQSRIMFKREYQLALAWLKSKGYEMSATVYYDILRRIDSLSSQRLFDIAKTFPSFHANEIEKMLMLEQQLYEEYHREQIPINRARILIMIAQIQPMITALYDSTQYVLESNATFNRVLSGQENQEARGNNPILSKV